jgi:CRP-like cAMP-binding protein
LFVPQDENLATTSPPPIRNRLLSVLPSADRAAVLACCTPVELEFGTRLCEPEQTFNHVYLPLSGFISLVATVPSHAPLEMGMIGNEGMLGATLALGVKVAPLQAVVQGQGSALRMSAAHLRRELATRPALQATLGRYLYVLMVQLSQSAACTRFHEVDQRLARWLLMTHDRAHANHFHLTHQFLADMLGVQRSAVTIAAGALAKKKLISYSRGNITVLSRKGLEAKSCSCYGAVMADYKRLFK